MRFGFLSLVAMATLSLLSCAPNMTGSALHVDPTTLPAQGQTVIVLGEFNGPDSLRAAFAQSLRNIGCFASVKTQSNSSQNSGAVVLDLKMTPHFTQNFAWPWYLGIAVLGPLWPAMPRNGDLTLESTLQISLDGKRLRNISQSEQEHFDLFWYGAYRTSTIDEQATFLYQKLFASLAFLVQTEFCSDSNDGSV